MGSEKPWSGYMPPFKVWGNLYFVGTQHASTHIIDTNDGLVMLDSGYQHSLYLVLHNMHTLGLDPTKIKYILHTHGHVDHCGATRALVKLTGAKTFLGAPDRDYVNGTLDLSWAKELNVYFQTFEPDVLLHDNDIISIGNTKIKAVSTPGHTPGAMSYVFDVHSGSRTLTAALHGGAGLNSMTKRFLDRYGLSYDCRKDYFASMDRLKTLEVDIFLGNHANQNGTAKKYKQLLAGNEDAFVNPVEWSTFAQNCKGYLQDLIEKENAEDTLI